MTKPLSIDLRERLICSWVECDVGLQQAQARRSGDPQTCWPGDAATHWSESFSGDTGLASSIPQAQLKLSRSAYPTSGVRQIDLAETAILLHVPRDTFSTCLATILIPAYRRPPYWHLLPAIRTSNCSDARRACDKLDQPTLPFVAKATWTKAIRANPC